MPPGSKTRKRVKEVKDKLVGRWKEAAGGRRVVLTVKGELWQREKGEWRLRRGVWTLDEANRWAAETGYVRAGDPGIPAADGPVNRLGLTYLCAPVMHDPDDCRVPVPPAYRDEFAARVERYAARAALGLPLFAGGGA